MLDGNGSEHEKTKTQIAFPHGEPIAPDAHKNLKVCRFFNSVNLKIKTYATGDWTGQCQHMVPESMHACVKQCQCTNRRITPPHTLMNQAKSLNLHHEADSFPPPNWSNCLSTLPYCTLSPNMVSEAWPFLKKLLAAAQQLHNEFSRAFGCILIFFPFFFLF